jgi:hypothetical protein
MESDRGSRKALIDTTGNSDHLGPEIAFPRGRSAV